MACHFVTNVVVGVAAVILNVIERLVQEFVVLSDLIAIWGDSAVQALVVAYDDLSVAFLQL